jgi:hypothetical protein
MPGLSPHLPLYGKDEVFPIGTWSLRNRICQILPLSLTKPNVKYTGFLLEVMSSL